LNARHSNVYSMSATSAKVEWLVVGPRTGPYVSWIDVAPSEEAARRQAVAWTAKSGASFSVMRALPASW
jgi:hypothetical protein